MQIFISGHDSEMINHGYLIVLKPEINVQVFDTSELVQKNIEGFNELKKAFSIFSREKYRGTSRSPLEAYPSEDEKIIEEFVRKGVDMHSNKKARIRLNEVIGGTEENDYDDSLIQTYDDTLSVFDLLDEPDRWEIIEVRRNEFSVGNSTLGFDIGYWDGDHFSLIADTIITPLWHPPIPEDYAELIDQLRILNENLLFKTPGDSEKFRSYYKSKSWAETECEEGEFSIIQVDKVKF